MPTADNDGVSLYYDTAGSGEVVAFVEDVGYGAWLWGWQHRAVAGPHEAVTWDLRGTGRSDRPEGPYSVADLAGDLEAVLADHGARRAHLVGSGLGGMVALQHALAYDRAKTLTLCGTAASGEHVDRDARDRLRADLDDHRGLERSLEPALSADFRDSHPDVVSGIAEWRSDDDADRRAWAWQAAAMDAFDLEDVLYEVTHPALVVHGEADAVVPVDAGRSLADGLPRGDVETYPGAGHLAFVERSRPINDRLLGFLETHGADD